MSQSSSFCRAALDRKTGVCKTETPDWPFIIEFENEACAGIERFMRRENDYCVANWSTPSWIMSSHTRSGRCRTCRSSSRIPREAGPRIGRLIDVAHCPPGNDVPPARGTAPYSERPNALDRSCGSFGRSSASNRISRVGMSNLENSQHTGRTADERAGLTRSSDSRAREISPVHRCLLPHSPFSRESLESDCGPRAKHRESADEAKAPNGTDELANSPPAERFRNTIRRNAAVHPAVRCGST